MLRLRLHHITSVEQLSQNKEVRALILKQHLLNTTLADRHNPANNLFTPATSII